MSLSSALISAQSVFTTTGQQTAIVSKNIANASNADYARRLALMGTSLNGAQVLSIQRSQNEALLKQNIVSISQSSAQSTLLSGLTTLKSALGGNDYEMAPSTYLASFRDALQTYASTPGNSTIAATVVSAAGDLVTSLNKTSAAVQDMRLDSDKEIATSVATLNGLLSDFETVNTAVQSAIGTGSDPSDALDQRDKILKQISEIVGISTVTRGSGDTVIYTSDGTVLFENKARQVTFTPTSGFDASTSGNGVYVDGVPLAAGTGGNTSGEGKLAALLQLRDEIAPQYQTQLDEIARGLVTLFQEGDPSGTPAVPYAPGLFTYTTSTPPATVPTAGTVEPGLAASLIVNPLAKDNPEMIRDGGFNGVIANTDNASGFSDLLDGFIDAFDGDLDFDATTGLDPQTTISSYATASVGWLEQLRSDASTANDNKTALLSRTAEALSNETGVSMDEELSLLLDLEQSYKASAKLVSTVDAMMAALLEAVG
ncbi:flagellar hook-associated protein FlgK [Pararhizobium arenae]|uniref:flagellar hook-associated protein FlgK n=1 Tax=Pararhizobium arenae TaxID=1856850 RepID=UPI00094ADD03|nr:flagellar hook-associated protein FlgK [Pararhizobium arenae]